MKKHPQLILEPKDKRGITAIVLCTMMAVFIGFAALAVDVGHLFVARNELQNAADAGALAGARFLINQEDGTVNSGANQIAYDAATANQSEGEAVEVIDWSSNGGDVQRGHWSLATRTFTPNPSLISTVLWDKTLQELDADPDFINAVRVRTRRETTPVASFFANIFGHQGFTMESEAVAYIGFAGTLQSWEVDQPIAICQESLLGLSGEYQCHVGRMINSGGNVESHETGGWTDFNQDNPCAGGTNAPTVRSLVCGEGNPIPITLGGDMATSGGEIQSAFSDLIRCWEEKTGKMQPWNLTLPVVTCPGNNVGTCEEVVGTVNINIVWITGAGEDPNYNEAPRQLGETNPYGPFVCSDPSNGELCWNEFVEHFNLQNVGEHSPAPYRKKSIYFLPDCEYHEPKGGTGGQNFGVLARIPVLVQ